MADCPNCGERDCFYSSGIGRPDYQTEWPEGQGDYSEYYSCDRCGYTEEVTYDIDENGNFKEDERIER
jgi:hypothetical protein